MAKRQPSIPMLVVTIALAAAAPACAQSRYYSSQPAYRDVQSRAYDTGYREGLGHGERDARDHRDFRVDRSREYRDADVGSWGDHDGYRRVFRDGYRAGYTEGYQRVARLERRGRGAP